jgi:hypothetical protein
VLITAYDLAARRALALGTGADAAARVPGGGQSMRRASPGAG